MQSGREPGRFDRSVRMQDNNFPNDWRIGNGARRPTVAGLPRDHGWRAGGDAIHGDQRAEKGLPYGAWMASQPVCRKLKLKLRE